MEVEKGGERKGEKEGRGREEEGKGICLLLNSGLATPLMAVSRERSRLRVFRHRYDA